MFMALDFPNIDPVAFSIGPLVVRWYSLAYLAGFIGGWKYIAALVKHYRSKNFRPNKKDIEDFVPWSVLGVILGGRIGYVLFYNWHVYAHDWSSIFRVWEGGMSFHGGVIGVILAMVIFSHLKKIPVLNLTDLVCAAVPIGLFFGRLANFVNGELYGRMTDVPWAIKFPEGNFIPRHPSQIYEAILEGLVLFCILFFMYRMPKIRERSGIVSAAFLILYALFRIMIEFFRKPDDQLGFIFGQITMGQILSTGMILFALGVLTYVFRNPDKKAD